MRLKALPSGAFECIPEYHDTVIDQLKDSNEQLKKENESLKASLDQVIDLLKSKKLITAKDVKSLEE